MRTPEIPVTFHYNYPTTSKPMSLDQIKLFELSKTVSNNKQINIVIVLPV